MRMRTVFIVSWICGILGITVSGIENARGVEYTYTDLYEITASGLNTQFLGIADGQSVGFGMGPSIGAHALLWTDSSQPAIDLNPPGFGVSQAVGTSGVQQVGNGAPGGNDPVHALLWTGTAASAVDLNPSGFTTSAAQGAYGTQQVGSGIMPATGNHSHALLWSGSAASAVDLSPAGFVSSQAMATDGTHQVGYGARTEADFEAVNLHALMWSGTASSAVDLNPDGYLVSSALGVSGTQEVGSGYRAGMPRVALLWSGTSSSAINLNPAGFDYSVAVATNGTQQVGYGHSPPFINSNHALIWSGSGDSAIDLQQFLPSTLSGSMAFAIDATGNVFGTAFDPSGVRHAIEWSPVPDPSATLPLWLCALGLWRRGRR